jgi:hypothetical protein
MCWIFAPGTMFAGWRIIGKVTSSSATLTTRTRCDMSPNLGPPNWVSVYVNFFGCNESLVCVEILRFILWVHLFFGFSWATQWLWLSGQLVWRRLAQLHLPSRHTVVTTCTGLLPLLEMFLKWELQEDCTDLGALMRRFDSEAQLESHELGRSLLFMVRDDVVGIDSLPRLSPIDPPINPFNVVRERLAAVDFALNGLHPQVHPLMGLVSISKLISNIDFYIDSGRK